MEIIDTHSFIGTNALFGLDYTLDSFLKVRQINSPDHDISFLAISVSAQTNHKISDIVRSSPDVFLGAYLQIVPEQYNLPSAAYTTAPAEIEQILKQDHEQTIKGFKFINAIFGVSNDDPALRPYFSVAQAYDMPFLLHCSSSSYERSSQKVIRNIMRRYPSLRIILAHFGGLNPEYVPKSQRLARDFENVYLNTTGFCGGIRRVDLKTLPALSPEEVKSGMRHYWGEVLAESMQDPVLSKKILFGTDYPYLAHDLYPLTQLPQPQVKRIMDNARALFGLP